MAIDVRLEMRAACEKHRRYKPAISAEAEINRGCGGCRELLALYAALNEAADKLA